MQFAGPPSRCRRWDSRRLARLPLTHAACRHSLRPTGKAFKILADAPQIIQAVPRAVKDAEKDEEIGSADKHFDAFYLGNQKVDEVQHPRPGRVWWWR